MLIIPLYRRVFSIVHAHHWHHTLFITTWLNIQWPFISPFIKFLLSGCFTGRTLSSLWMTIIHSPYTLTTPVTFPASQLKLVYRHKINSLLTGYGCGRSWERFDFCWHWKRLESIPHDPAGVSTVLEHRETTRLQGEGESEGIDHKIEGEWCKMSFLDHHDDTYAPIGEYICVPQ